MKLNRSKILQQDLEVEVCHGALSEEAHETLAIGMNRVKGASCSGERR